jgi:hypothetical protein
VLEAGKEGHLLNIVRAASIILQIAVAATTLVLGTASVVQADERAGQKERIAEETVELVADAGAVESEQDQVNKANNPLADLIAVNLHNYYSPRLNGIPDESANTMWLRAVTPYWRLIPRVSLPIKVAPVADTSTTPTSYNSVTGIGDLNIFATFVVTPDDSPATLGIGPIYTAPTATDDALGAGKHEIGAAALTIWSKGILLLGALVNYQIGVGGDSSKPRTQFIGAQPIMMLQLGKGYYLRSAPIWYFNIEEPGYNVPFGLGAGKVIPTEKVVYNLFIEPQFSVAIRGVGQPAVQIFAGINLQFKTTRKKKKSEQAAYLANQLQAEHSMRSRMQ